jgi:uncharacterized protein YjiS (DUF1127 family)
MTKARKTLATPLRSRFGWLVELLRIWRRRLEDRRELDSMKDRELRDIGLTRFDANCEVRKPFWRA